MTKECLDREIDDDFIAAIVTDEMTSIDTGEASVLPSYPRASTETHNNIELDKMTKTQVIQAEDLAEFGDGLSDRPGHREQNEFLSERTDNTKTIAVPEKFC